MLRRTAGGFAAAGLLAAGSLAVGAPAQAADTVFTLGGPAETAVHPYPASGAPQKSSLGLTVNNPDPDEESMGYEGEVTYTLDLSGIAGVAELSVAEDTGSDCEITGATAVCQDYGASPGLSSIADFDLAASKGSKEGASGTIRVTGSADGVTFAPFSTKVTVGGPDLVMKRLPFKQELKPGDVQPAPITFTNNGTRAADGVLLTLMYSRGLEIPERYANCEYNGEKPGDVFTWSTALCSVEGSFEPGATYTLAVPLSVKASERAFYDMFVYRVNEDSAAQRSAQRAGAAFSRGTGEKLTLKKVTASARSADLAPRDNQQEADFRTKNTADFAALGDKGAGSVGETVVADLGFRNDGPAWVGYLRSGEAIGTLDVTVPEGAEVTDKPDSCQAKTAKGEYREEQLGAPRYFCGTSMTVRDGETVRLPFDLKINKVVPNATGAVTIRNTRLAAPVLPFDPEPANNAARLVLNSDGSDDSGSDDSGGTSEGTTGTAGSTQGTTAGTTTGTTSGTSGTSGASGTSGTSGSTSASGTTGSSGNQSAQDGGLASTGSVALLAGGAAATALAAGGVLYVMSRRRTGRG